MERAKEFTTSDLYLTSAISILLKIKPDFIVKNNRTLFVFQVSNDLYQAMSDFNSGVAINAYDFSQMIKRMRSEMITRRDMKNNNGRH
ncbi:MAG TPA: hypothetical protein ENH24_00565 [Nitrospirae bacterium]|nr:hypothetical protein BMS3Bbin08_00065 [bacterium BMS3Bbin08]HDH52962.1 hypothetical protein [Nitrospirota bacterium]